MKKILVLISLIIFSCISEAQEYKRGNTWTLGFSPVSIMDFSNTSIIFDSLNFPAISSGTSCISDTNGSLLFFTSGFAMLTRKGFVMQNGLDVNCPYGQVLSNYYSHRSIFPQTSIILPKKGNTYYVFSTGMSDSVANNYINLIKTEWDVLSYCVVDMDSNVGMGKVVLKDKVLADKQHYHNTALHAVKHSNGKDWWLVKSDCENNRYNEYLIKEDTILGPYYQYMADTLVGCHFYGTLIFNTDGDKMASSVFASQYEDSTLFTNIPNNYKFKGTGNNYWYMPNRVDIYDFNRCDGTIKFRNFYVTPYDTNSYPNNDYKAGISFSPNGKLLYAANFYTLYQIDVDDTIKTNGLFIHGPDTNINYFPWYDQMGLAPNGKIYIGNANGTRKYMSYIDKPNVKGLGCDFMPQGLSQPFNNNLKSPPNMPNYGLGADSTITPCWPLQTSSNLPQSEEFEVYPNPASTLLTTSPNLSTIKDGSGKSEEQKLYNCVGQLILVTNQNRIDVSNLSRGVYYLQRKNKTKKVIVE